MNKKLPSVFANKIDRSINNNEKVSVTKEDEIIEKKVETKNINQKINDIFSSTKYVYKADVIIVTKEQKLVKKIIGKNSNNIITIDNELIPISNIVDIYYQ